MSDSAVATPATPSPAAPTTDVPAAPAAPDTSGEATTQETKKPTSAREFMEQVNDRARGRGTRKLEDIAAATESQKTEVNAAGRKIDADTKRFVKDGEAPDGPSADTSPGAQASEPEAAVAPQDPAPGAPEQAAPEIVEIELPEGHPLRERGQTHLRGPKELENDLRYAANHAIRSSALKDLQSRMEQLERQAQEAQATAEFWQSQSGSLQSPEYLQQLDDIRRTYGDEAAERFARGQQAESQAQLQQKLQEQRAQAESMQLSTQARTFANEAFMKASSRYRGWGAQKIDQALASYAGMLEATGQPMDLASFQRHADALYLQDPQVQAAARKVRQQRQAKQVDQAATQKATELDKQRQADYAAGQRKNPLGSTPPVDTGLSVPVSADDKPKSAPEFLASVRRRARGGRA